MHAVPDLLRSLARNVDVVPRRRDQRSDALVLACDRVEIVQPVEDVLERARLQDHLDHRRILRLVDVDHAQVELPHHLGVLTAEEVQPLRLEVEELVQPIEPALMQRKILLEGRELLRDVADPALERPDLHRDVRDLRSETGFLLTRGGEASPNVLELAAVVT